MGASTPQVFKTLGPHLISGQSLNAALGNGLANYSDAITALASGGAAGAPLLAYGINHVTVTANANDSAMMPPSLPGASVMVTNNGAQSLQVFANTTSSLPAGTLDTINGTAGATGVAVAAAKTALFMCSVYGAWFGPVALA
jgi:hypothetical protein